MIKVGITGSIGSGKTTSSKFLSYKNGPLFSADRVVRKLYKKKSFRKLVAKLLNIKLSRKFNAQLKNKILDTNENLDRLEKIIHPIVRKEMFNFLKINKNKKILFLEIPLLIESNLAKYFDVLIFIKSRKSLRLKRYKMSRGNEKLFALLDSRQIKDTKKMNYCDYVIVNNKSLTVLKKKLSNIVKKI